ncbi:MAG: type II secretion system protein GspD, partial [Victivallaceae bacterium]
KFLDKPQMGAFFGTQTFFYLPKYVPSRNLMPLIENVGMNISDVTEVWQGMDLVSYDPDLNWLIFDVVNFSMYNIEKMLAKYDVPIPQVRLKIKVYELYSENDDKIGVDFQAWKNNDGMDFFSAGGRYRDNWSAVYNGGMANTGSERTSFYNFNPKWNSRYIDFMVSKGKASLAYTGELCIRNNTPAKLSRLTQIFYFDTTKQAPDATDTPDMGVGPYELLSTLVDRIIAASKDYPVAKDNQQLVEKFAGFGFTMNVANASVNLKETRFTMTLSNTSLIGLDSSGRPRISKSSTVQQDVSLPHGVGAFVIGGLRKQETVKSSTGIPFLMNIPYLGYLFSTKSTSVKNSSLVLVGECEWDAPPADIAEAKNKK